MSQNIFNVYFPGVADLTNSESEDLDIEEILAEFRSNGTDQELDGFDSWIQQFDYLGPIAPQSRAPLSIQKASGPILEQTKKPNPTRSPPRGKENGGECSTFKYCVFCFNNQESPEVYSSHKVKDDAGRVICPSLFCYKCPICGISGEKAHTVKYCPQKRIITMEDTLNRKKPIRF